MKYGWGLLCIVAAIAIRPAIARADADCDAAEAWDISTTDANGNEYELDSFPARVTIIFYEGQTKLHLNDDFKETMQNDGKVGRSGSLLSYVNYLGIANYDDVRAPNWLVRQYLKKRIKKFGVPVLDDKDSCFSGSGTSKKCKTGERVSYFEPSTTNFVVLYDHVPVLKLTGTLDADTVVPHVASIAQAAADDHDVCWVVENLHYDDVH